VSLELVFLTATSAGEYHRLNQATAAIPAKTGCGRPTARGLQATRPTAVLWGATACGAKGCWPGGAP
jgi:hypothetical protein